MKGKIWADLAAVKMITDKNVSNRHLNYEHVVIKNLNSGKIIHEKLRFSTTC
jgi:hypothetical protein